MPRPRTKKTEPFRLLSKRELNIIRGKTMVGHATVEDSMSVLNHLALLEMKLDELGDEDFFGTEGWRHFFAIPESD